MKDNASWAIDARKNLQKLNYLKLGDYVKPLIETGTLDIVRAFATILIPTPPSSVNVTMAPRLK